jgi:hypothetical protein
MSVAKGDKANPQSINVGLKQKEKMQMLLQMVSL